MITLLLFYLPQCFSSLKPDDVAIYFRWLVVHLHSIKKVCSYLKLLQWLPVIHRNDIELQLAAPVQTTSDANFSKQGEWNDKVKQPVSGITVYDVLSMLCIIVMCILC